MKFVNIIPVWLSKHDRDHITVSSWNRTALLAFVLFALLSIHDVVQSQTASTAMKIPSADKGNAVLVFFYTGDDDYITKVAQGVGVNIKHMFDGYKYKVLLKHDEDVKGWDIDKVAEGLADVVDIPTMDNLAKYLKKLAGDGYIVDMYIIGHGSSSSWLVSNGSYGTYNRISPSELESGLSSSTTGYKVLPIRMVYTTQCWGKNFNEAWRTVGAKVVMGSEYVNFYPNQMNIFVSKWNDGNTFKDCLEKSNTSTTRTLVQTYLSTIHAPLTKGRGEWGGCPLGKTVLGSHSCAEDYFSKVWGLDGSDWDDSMSGKENMNNSSIVHRRGDTDLKKTSSVSWH